MQDITCNWDDVSVPQHVAIVMDGNGRWAQKNGLPRHTGHIQGSHAARAIVRHCIRRKIKYLTLFVLSTENWHRPATEVSFLMSLLARVLQHETTALCQAGVCLKFIGDRTVLRQKNAAIVSLMGDAEEKTRHNNTLQLIVAVNYGGRWDVLQAIKQLLRAGVGVDSLTDTILRRYLSLGDIPDPDLFIRTSGEERISNFFLWQLAYTEFYFARVYWPDFGENDFDRALLAYSQRVRRFGLTNTQLVR